MVFHARHRHPKDAGRDRADLRSGAGLDALTEELLRGVMLTART